MLTIDRSSPHHGGDVDQVRARFPDAPLPWVDLSTGINPVPYPRRELDAEVWNRLPTRSAQAELVDAAAFRYGVSDPSCVVAAPGTQGVISLLPRLFPSRTVTVLGPTYSEHILTWRRTARRVCDAHSLSQIKPLRGQIIVVVNPDNPTGRVVPVADLISLASELGSDGLLVVDEAFVDPTPDASIAPKLPSNAIALRSFGKMYGLAGLRLGFAVAAPEMAFRLAVEMGPWAVSGPAIAIGVKALRDDEWLSLAISRLRTDAARLDNMLNESGLTPSGGTALFRLVRHVRAAAIADLLAERGIHVRRFDDRPQHLRVGLPAPSAWGRLAGALSAVPQ